jgi:hypothetical protein
MDDTPKPWDASRFRPVFGNLDREAADQMVSGWCVMRQAPGDLRRYLSRRSTFLGGLKAAVCGSDAARVRQVLDRYPELRARIDDPLPDYGFGEHALFAAVQRSDRATIDVLLRAGSNIRKRTEWWARGFGVLDDCDPSMVEFLTGRGAGCACGV